MKSSANFFLISTASSLFFTPSAAPPPSVSQTASSEPTAIQPGSVISGYPVAPTYTFSRYDEDCSYLANPANGTEPLDLIKIHPAI